MKRFLFVTVGLLALVFLLTLYTQTPTNEVFLEELDELVSNTAVVSNEFQETQVSLVAYSDDPVDVKQDDLKEGGTIAVSADY